MQEFYALIDGIPGEFFLWLLMLWIMILWGRKKEREKAKRQNKF